METATTGLFHIWSASTKNVFCDAAQPAIILRDDWAARVDVESLCPECAMKWRAPDHTAPARPALAAVRLGLSEVAAR